MKKEDLVVLMYASRSYMNVVNISKAEKESDLEIDLEKEMWSYSDWHNVQIGTHRSIIGREDHPFHEGILGVYDRTDTEHLNSMVRYALSAIRFVL